MGGRSLVSVSLAMQVSGSAFRLAGVVFACCLFPVLNFNYVQAQSPAPAPSPAGQDEYHEKEALQPGQCEVTVRVIKGSGRSAISAEQELETGEFISDVKHQLQPLPFQSYKVIDSAIRRFEIGTSEDISVFTSRDTRHVLRILPQWAAGERVQVQVDWSGPQGENLLSTKVSVVRGKNVVVGTDEDENSSTIMCIKVDCKCPVKTANAVD